MDLRLYDYSASANCYKVRLLLAQLGRPYERVPVDIFDGDTLTDAFAAINPARSTPVLQVGGEHLPESDAILAFLAEGTDLMPAAPVERGQVLRWLFFEQTGVMMTIGGLRFRLLTGRFPADSDAASGAAVRRSPRSRCSRAISRATTSSSPVATASPTSGSTATRTWRARRASISRPSPPYPPGASGSPARRAT
jgi:glutathione S-transferase